MLIGNTKFIPTNHMTSNEGRGSPFPHILAKCQGVSGLLAIHLFEAMLRHLTPLCVDLFTTICSPRLCCHFGKPNRYYRYKSLCPLVLQLPVRYFQLLRTPTQKGRLRIISLSWNHRPLGSLLPLCLSYFPPSQEYFSSPSRSGALVSLV